MALYVLFQLTGESQYIDGAMGVPNHTLQNQELMSSTIKIRP